MTRLASTVSLAFLLSVVSCGSSDNKTNDGAVTADSGPTADTAVGGDTAASDTASADGAAGMCVGSFSTINRATLGAATMAAGKCSAATDLDLICATNIRDIAAACGVACVGMGDACTAMCVKNKAALSDGCIGCYTAAVVCAQKNCLVPCLMDSKGDACTQCQVTNGCLSGFFACSGLPSGAAPGDGGAPAGDGGSSSDGGSASDAGVTSDGAAADAPAITDVAAATDTAATTD